MSKTKSTKSALLMSFTSLLLCFAMLIGSTFAWFTDSATASVNTIQSGTLDVALEMKQGTEWVNAEGETLSWVKAAGGADQQVLWEPGCTYELPELRIVNKGNLALKYKIAISGIQGDAELNNAIEWTINDTALDADHSLAAGASATLTIKGHMKESAGNDYQGLSIEGIAITVNATQLEHEYDSTTNEYDANAEYAIPVATADELAAALAGGKDVVLTAPIQMPEVIEIKNDVTIYGGENGQLLVPNNADRVINVNDNTGPVTLTLSPMWMLSVRPTAPTPAAFPYTTTPMLLS